MVEYSEVTDGIFRCDIWNIPITQRDWLSAESAESAEKLTVFEQYKPLIGQFDG